MTLTRLTDDRYRPLYDKRDHCTPLPEVYPKVCGLRDINIYPKYVGLGCIEEHIRRSEEWAREEDFKIQMKEKRRNERWGWQN